MDLLKTKKRTMRFSTMAAASALLALGATKAHANGVNGGTFSGSVTATVDNTVTVAQTTALTFGSIVIITSGTAANLDAVMTSGGVVTWPGTTGVGVNYKGANGTGLGHGGGNNRNPRIFPTGATAPAAGVFAISGGAANAAMGVIYNNSTVNVNTVASTLTNAGCLASTLSVLNFTDNSTAGIITLDGSGAFTLNVGATLRADNNLGDNTNSTGTAGPFAGTYCDGAYSGTFVVSVVY